MKDIQIGQIVFSKQGRDKGKAFIVTSIEENFVFLVDGKLRKIINPKKKKLMHIQRTNYIDSGMKEKILAENYLDSDFKTAIKNFLSD
ncbi:MAG: KOW domain-containing RNA-binding protein [Defluviitaleaceae bacterium]|nr:KOW domain-containing RNA-binding protein [Defluviitaleaceae bacterium]